MYATILGVCSSGLVVLGLQCAMFGASDGEQPSGQDSSRAIAKKESLRLTLSKISAEQTADGIVFVCEAVLVNETGAVVNVKSHFYSAFDGIELVVFGSDGSKLRQLRYTAHQSPYSLKENLFPLKIGDNRQTLRFRGRLFPDDVDKVGVVLIGTLPGNEYGSVLCSNMATISIKRGGQKRAAIDAK
jgi:hypothetical protein